MLVLYQVVMSKILEAMVQETGLSHMCGRKLSTATERKFKNISSSGGFIENVLAALKS